jgi:hypothetical protein
MTGVEQIIKQYQLCPHCSKGEDRKRNTWCYYVEADNGRVKDSQYLSMQI